MRRSKPNPYPDDWNKIAHDVKESVGWKCIRCGHIHDVLTGHVLTIHHLDMDPAHSDPVEYWWNLLPLCQKCHLSIQARLVLEREWLFEHTEWFRPYYAAYLKWKEENV
jgi:5-methylcytosine-specific restriction endonuclease McrA